MPTKKPSKPVGTKLKGFSPKNPLLSPRFADIATFARLPHTQDLQGVDAAIIGIPFDGGTTYRPGARLAPRSIRNMSVMNRNYSPEQSVHIYEKLSVVDYGDIPCNPLNLKKSFSQITAEYAKIIKNNVIPVGVGGDHSVLIPILKALSKKHGRFGLIQFDAHTDTADQAWGEKFHHGTPIRRLIEDKTLKGQDILQIGIRGGLTAKDQLEWDRKQGITHVNAEGFSIEGLKNIIKNLNKKIPYYMTFDVDCLDPAFAPGTGTPVVGGLTSREALQAVRAFSGFNFIGFDVVEISPPYDSSDITSLLGAQLIFEFLALAAAVR